MKNSDFSYLYGSISYLFGYEKNRCFLLKLDCLPQLPSMVCGATQRCEQGARDEKTTASLHGYGAQAQQRSPCAPTPGYGDARSTRKRKSPRYGGDQSSAVTRVDLLQQVVDLVVCRSQLK